MSTGYVEVEETGKRLTFVRRDLKVLAAIRDHGYIRADQLAVVIRQRGVGCARVKKVYEYTSRLSRMGFVSLNCRGLVGNISVLTVTDAGHNMLRECGYGLNTHAKAESDPAGVEHFLSLTDMMLRFSREYAPVNYWLTDFVVRSENNLRGTGDATGPRYTARPEIDRMNVGGLAKDYDAVGEIMVNERPLTIAIEYEHTLKASSKYEQMARSYAVDPYIQLVVCVLDSENWVAPVVQSFRVPGHKLCFVNYAQFSTSSFEETTAVRWNGKNVTSTVLARALQEASYVDAKPYLPSYKPPQ